MNDKYLFEIERLKLKQIDLIFEIENEKVLEIQLHLKRYLKFINKEIKNFEYINKLLERQIIIKPIRKIL